VRGEWGESCRGRVGGCKRIGGGFGLHAWGVSDVRAHGDTHVIPDANSLADTRTFRGR